MRSVVLHGYRPSGYTWAARLGLALKGVSFEVRAANPFDPSEVDQIRALHPFKRVPVLEHDCVRIFETAAILTYLDAAFSGPDLSPAAPLARARMVQVQGIVDGYGYWPLVQQVYVHGVARADGTAAELAAGLRASVPVLDALEQLAVEGLVLGAKTVTLADAHLYLMLDYFQRQAEARAMLDARPCLATWYEVLSAHPAIDETRPEIVS